MIKWTRGNDGIYRAIIQHQYWKIEKQSNHGYNWVVWLGDNIMKFAHTLREGKEYVKEYGYE